MSRKGKYERVQREGRAESEAVREQRGQRRRRSFPLQREGIPELPFVRLPLGIRCAGVQVQERSFSRLTSEERMCFSRRAIASGAECAIFVPFLEYSVAIPCMLQLG